jgi:hypothetical protein
VITESLKSRYLTEKPWQNFWPNFVNIGQLVSKLKWWAHADFTVIAFVRERKNATDRKMCVYTHTQISGQQIMILYIYIEFCIAALSGTTSNVMCG